MKLRMRPAGAFLLLAGVSACDIPTGMPRWETSWIAPGEEISVAVAEVLPPGITVNADTSGFLIAIDTITDGFTLGELCGPACPAGSFVAPKPAFQHTARVIVPLVAQLESGSVTGGELAIDLTNGFSFDPLRPGSGPDTGSITIEVRSNGNLVADFEIDGKGRTFPPGQVLKVVTTFANAEIGDTLTVDLIIDSPAGDVTTVDTDEELGVDIHSDGVEVEEVVVDLSSEPIEALDQQLDLSDVDLSDRLNDGAIFLDIENPFGVAGALQLVIDPPGASQIVKPVPLVAGNSDVGIEFTEAEIEQLTGETSTMTISGAVSGNNLTIRPDMVMRVTPRLRVTIEIGGESDEGEN